MAEDFAHVWQIGQGFAMTDETIDARSAVKFTKTDAGEAVGWTTDIVGGVVGTSDKQGFDMTFPLNGATSLDYDYAGRVFAANTKIESRIEFYDAEGQRILDFDLNARGRIETVYRDGAVAASYTYDVFEQRIAKTATDNFGNVTDVHYHYDREGRLIGETSAATGEFLREYVWIGLTPIATYGENPTPGNGGPTVLHYLHADHLKRPAYASDVAGQVVWEGGITTPFGMQIETMGAVTQSLMFPGQYADEETGYYDNWHRTYDPILGRYLQSDPIGLAGGLNRYAYVGGNPVIFIDPDGLKEIGIRFGISGSLLAGGKFGIEISFDTKSKQFRFRGNYGGLIGLGGGFDSPFIFRNSYCAPVGWSSVAVSEINANISVVGVRKELSRVEVKTYGVKKRTGPQPLEYNFPWPSAKKDKKNKLKLKDAFKVRLPVYEIGNEHGFSSAPLFGSNTCGCEI